MVGASKKEAYKVADMMWQLIKGNKEPKKLFILHHISRERLRSNWKPYSQWFKPDQLDSILNQAKNHINSSLRLKHKKNWMIGIQKCLITWRLWRA